MASRPVRALALTLALATSIPAAALASAPAAEAPPATVSMQGDQASWISDPHTHAFYALAVAAFANGPAKVDRAKFQSDAFAIFRDFGKSRGMKPEAMVDHLKLIPGQVVQIATEDPKVLASYDNFVVAIFGPP